MSRAKIIIGAKNLSKEEFQEVVAGYKRCADYCKNKLEELDEYSDYVKQKVGSYEKLASEIKEKIIFPPQPSESLMDFTQFTAKQFRIKMYKSKKN